MQSRELAPHAVGGTRQRLDASHFIERIVMLCELTVTHAILTLALHGAMLLIVPRVDG